MVGLSVNWASQWTGDMGTAVAKEASPVGDSKAWHCMEGFVWTGGGSQMLRRMRTELERVGMPAGDQGRKVTIVRETDQRLVLGRPGKENTIKFEEICEPRLVHRRATGDGVSLVQPVGFEDGVDVVRLEGAVEDPMVMVVRDGINQVQPVAVENTTEVPMVDGVDMVHSEGSDEDIKQTQGCSVVQAQGLGRGIGNGKREGLIQTMVETGMLSCQLA